MRSDAPASPSSTFQVKCGDSRFFAQGGPQTLSAVARIAQADVPDNTLLLRGIAPLQLAEAEDVSFLDNPKYASALDATRAGAVIIHPKMRERVPRGTVAIATAEPYAAWARVAALFYPERPAKPGIHPSAIVDARAKIDPSAEIGPLVVIEADAKIGAGCKLAPGVIIGSGVVIGADCRIGAQASISHAVIGARVYIYPGVRIGQEGFGFAPTSSGFISVPQLGIVVIGDDVEVGANSTIDRGSVRNTVIGAGTRIDNLVQIGHNVVLGRCCVIVAQVGISGSTEIEDFVQIGGQAGVAGHVVIGKGAQIGAQSGVISDVAPGARLVGGPARPVKEYFRQIAILKKLAKRGE